LSDSLRYLFHGSLSPLFAPFGGCARLALLACRSRLDGDPNRGQGRSHKGPKAQFFHMIWTILPHPKAPETGR
jgi:hypothetical protein